MRSRGRSVNVVSDYGLDDRMIELRSPLEAKDFSSSLCVQTSSEVHPASYAMGTGGPFPVDKAQPGRDADLSPNPVPRSRISRSYTSSPTRRLHVVLWDRFTFTFTFKTRWDSCTSETKHDRRTEPRWKLFVSTRRIQKKGCNLEIDLSWFWVLINIVSAVAITVANTKRLILLGLGIIFLLWY
jgi:hypothetical protein